MRPTEGTGDSDSGKPEMKTRCSLFDVKLVRLVRLLCGSLPYVLGIYVVYQLLEQLGPSDSLQLLIRSQAFLA